MIEAMYLLARQCAMRVSDLLVQLHSIVLEVCSQVEEDI